MSRSQFHLTKQNLARLTDAISDRDHQILLTLAIVRYATARQFEQIHFTSGTPLSNARQCQLALTRLTKLHVLERLHRQIGGARSGSKGHIYRLDRAGRVLAGQRISQPGEHWIVGGMFMRHNLAITELYVRCKGYESNGHFKIRRFETEPFCWRRLLNTDHEQIKPDAYIQVSTGGYRYHWFIEMDMATEIGTRVSTKLKRYIQYRETGREQAKHKVFPGVLYLVPHERRRNQLQQIFERLPEHDQKIFRVALQSEAIPTLTGEPSL